jgi:hypothetical protein
MDRLADADMGEDIYLTRLRYVDTEIWQYVETVIGYIIAKAIYCITFLLALVI